MFILLSSVIGFLYLKNKTGASFAPTKEDAKKLSTIATLLSGSAPSNDRSASPSPQIAFEPQSSGDDLDGEDDDGLGMGRTAQLTQLASGDSPEIGGFDQNLTQDDSGADNAGTQLWKPPVALRGYNKVLYAVWDEVLDVDYFSPDPSVIFQFMPPPNMRQDNDPRFNSQPWTRVRGHRFLASNDPSQYYETPSGHPQVPILDDSQDEDDDE